MKRPRKGLYVAQQRSLHVKTQQAFEMLGLEGIETQSQSPSDATQQFHLSIAIDRTALSPCVTVSFDAKDPKSSLRIPFKYAGPDLNVNSDTSIPSQIISFLGIESEYQKDLSDYISALYKIFKDNEAFLLETKVSLSSRKTIIVHDAKFRFDDAAYRSSGRHENLHKLRDIASEVPEEVRAEKSGIVYVKCVNPSVAYGEQ